MQCPQCHQQMKKSTINNITIDECLACKGMWFDRGELDQVKDEVLPDLGWLEIDTWQQQANLLAKGSRQLCPKCHNTTLTTVMDQQSQTMIDMCAQCKGTWLPAGQFLNLINAMLDTAVKKSAPEYVRISLQKVKDMLTSSDPFSSDWEEFKTVLNLLQHRIFIQHPKLKSLVEGLQKTIPH
jgi:Zn-finger nucleic acid-binding protein